MPDTGWAWVALGANLGDGANTVRAAMDALQALSAGPLLRSSLWVSSPVECPPGSPQFVNAVVGLKPAPQESPESLLGKLHRQEESFGHRFRRVRNEPRHLDLDLIAFGTEVRATPQLTLPHPRAHERRFVLEPLAELAPDLVLPGQTRSVRELLAGLTPGQEVRRLDPPS
jgi:2-amino-4-hydroxy-6-hydroxymethyldihydropteridine diphosphokinase